MKKVRCALYDRVSHELQAKYGLSLETQMEDLRQYAVDHDYEIVGTYSDEGITARKKLQNRKDFMRLLNDVKQDKIDLILVTKLDRWFRNVKDYHNTQAILEAHHCNWKTVHEDYDTSTADGQLKINIMLAVAQNECDRTSERIKVVFAHKKRQGQHVTGAAPYGFILGDDKKLHKDPEREHIVDEIFKYYFSCFSKRRTVFYILDKYNDDEKLTEYKINRILSHEVYAGIYDGIEGYHPAYITPEQYREIHKISTAKSYPHTREPYLFSGLIKCPHCGSCLSGITKKQKLGNGDISHYKRYRCSRKFDYHSSPCITESVVEEYMIANLIPQLEINIFNIQQQQQAMKKNPQNRVSKIKAEMNRLNLLFQKGRIEETYYDQEYGRLEKELKKEQPVAVPLEKYLEIRKSVSGDWQRLYDKLDVEHRKAFWKRTIKEIHVDPETHKICGFEFLV